MDPIPWRRRAAADQQRHPPLHVETQCIVTLLYWAGEEEADPSVTLDVRLKNLKWAYYQIFTNIVSNLRPAFSLAREFFAFFCTEPTHHTHTQWGLIFRIIPWEKREITTRWIFKYSPTSGGCGCCYSRTTSTTTASAMDKQNYVETTTRRPKVNPTEVV